MDEFTEQYAKMCFHEKLMFSKRVNSMACFREVEHYARYLSWDGYLRTIPNKGVVCDEGDYYVYLWKHAWGDPFYVGSGRGDRWRKKSPRCDDFYLHLDQADAVVYKILDGVDSKTAHLYEKYVSVDLGRAGYTLANGDNNFEYATGLSQQRMIEKCETIVGSKLTKKVETAVINILSDNPRCDYRITDYFIMEYGSDYFSRHFLSGRHNKSCRA